MDLRNEKLVIIEIQQNLLELWQAKYPLTYVIPDGIYGRVTRRAVREFQINVGIPGTGIVDYDTWTRLTSAARQAENNRQLPLPIAPDSEINVRQNEKSDTVLLIQIMLSALSLWDFEKIPISGVYDDETMQAVQRLQTLHGLPPTDFLDTQTWNLLASAYHYAVLGSDQI